MCVGGGPITYVGEIFETEDWAKRQFSWDTLIARSTEGLNLRMVDYGCLRRRSLGGGRAEETPIGKKRYSDY